MVGTVIQDNFSNRDLLKYRIIIQITLDLVVHTGFMLFIICGVGLTLYILSVKTSQTQAGRNGALDVKERMVTEVATAGLGFIKSSLYYCV